MKPYVRTGLIWSTLMIIIMCGVTLWTIQALPADGQFPLHWGPDGQPDRWGDRSDAVFLLWLQPGLAAGIALLLAVMAYIDPRHRNIDKSRTAYLTVWIGVMALLTALTIGIALLYVRGSASAAANDETIRWILVGVGVLMIVMGNFLPKTRRSFSFGIRTPWTLSDDTVWERTHRLGGPLFMLAGAAGIVSALVLDGIWITVGVTGPVVSVALILVVYSYFAWRSVDRQSEA